MIDARPWTQAIGALSITVPSRRIPLSAIRDAANSIYARPFARPSSGSKPLGRCPTLYLKLELLQPIGSFKVRGAHNVVRQLSAADLRDGVWTVSAGNAAQGWRSPGGRSRACVSVMVMDTAPETKIRAIERLGASIVRATYRRMLAHRGIARIRSHARLFRPSVRRRSVHRRKRHHRARNSRGSPDVDAIVAPLGGGGLPPALPRRSPSSNPPRESTQPSRPRRPRCPPRLPQAGRCTLTDGPHRSSTAPAASPC